MSAASLVNWEPSVAGQMAPSGRMARIRHYLGVLTFVLLHLACLAILLSGTTTLALALCGVFYLVRMFGITAGYHRYFAHHSYKTSRTFQFLLACLGCSAMQKGPLWWVGHHRSHHRHSDTPEDPHSPRAHSVWWSHLGWILAADYKETNWEAVRDLSRFPELRWLDRYHLLPPLLLAVLCFLIAGWSGLVWGFIVSTVLVYHGVFAVNSLCHLFGRRPYATADQSRNNLLVAFVTLGEGWHNNHHYYQSSANQGFRWWEIDITFYLIRLFGWAGLVWDIRRPPCAKLRKKKRGRTAGPSRVANQRVAE